jgi:crossover junction endodeoxyribonuclease RuvC
MVIWGIDPGINGALVAFDIESCVLDIHDMPIMEVRGKKTISPQLVRGILAQEHGPIVIERVGAMPGQGVSSMFNFGKGFGILLGVAAGLEMPIHEVAPQTWQKALKVPPGKDGNRQRACELLPAYAQSFSRKKDDGRADAALIAYYGVSNGVGVD